MLLYVVRHGIALNKTDPSSPEDAARPLTPEGVEKTTAAARGLADFHVHPALLISSPLLRAIQTAELFAEELDFPVARIRRSESLRPESKPALFLAELSSLKAREVMCFGHAPHLDLLIAAACVGKSPAFTRMKKSGVALLEFDTFAPPKAILHWVYPAKVLRRLAG